MIRLLTLVLILSNFSFAQISPGDLSKSHSKFEGMSNCTKCHVLGDQVTNQKCLDCHSEIKQLISSGRGYHAYKDVKNKNCFDCHSEHHGVNFKLIRFDQNSFNHEKTGYTLTGKHTGKKCGDCHNPSFISNSKIKSNKGTFLGLSSDCASCHKDAHNKTLGNNCNSCHTTEGFKPAVSFDHSKAAFKLKDAHTKVECGKCHAAYSNDKNEKLVFSVARFSKCNDCHKDVHSGKFGENCTECHSTVSFKTVSGGKFDHNKTGFPLAGAHITVKCESCHGSSLTSKPKHKLCIDCHKDYHKGQFTRAGVTRDCSECHSTDAFMPSLYTLESHLNTQFPLTGRHLSIPCSECHQKGEELVFAGTKKKCIECHDNLHAGELNAGFMPDQKCEACHVTENWKNISFDHNRTKFQLAGKHLSPPCAECHTNRNQLPSVKYLFASVNKNCINCHRDVHFGQFGKDADGCLKCHNYNDWKPSLFNHSATKFPLTGAHEKVDCAKCHNTVETINGKYKKFKLEDYRCVTCHS